MNAADLEPLEIVVTELETRWHQERRELLRRAAQAAIDRAAAGQAVDPLHLVWARDFVRANQPLSGPLSSGEPGLQGAAA